MSKSKKDPPRSDIDAIKSILGNGSLDIENLKASILVQDGVAVLLADDDGNYLYVNEAATQLFGFSQTEFLLMNVRDIRLINAPNPLKQYKEFMNNGLSAGILHFYDKSDQQRAGLYRAKRIAKDMNLSVMVDVTDHFAMYDDMLDRLNEQVDVLNNLPAIAFRYQHHPDGTAMFSFVSDNAAKLLRVKNPRSIMECSFGDMVIEEDHDEYLSVINTALREGQPFATRARMRLGDGSIATFEIRAHPVKKKKEVVYYGTYFLV